LLLLLFVIVASAAEKVRAGHHQLADAGEKVKARGLWIRLGLLHDLLGLLPFVQRNARIVGVTHGPCTLHHVSTR
jgi:hypothetical protein